jgi:hypothetical protein
MMENHAVIFGRGDTSDADLLTHPDEVISDNELSAFDKRAILADWASDARAVEDAPQVRQLDNGAFVCVGDVLNALRLLDTAPTHMPTPTRLPFARGRNAPTSSRTFKHNFDDNRPPPCAAGASIPRRLIYTIAKAVPLLEAA